MHHTRLGSVQHFFVLKTFVGKNISVRGASSLNDSEKLFLVLAFCFSTLMGLFLSIKTMSKADFRTRAQAQLITTTKMIKLSTF